MNILYNADYTDVHFPMPGGGTRGEKKIVSAAGKATHGVSREEKRLKEACKGFEAIFIHEILKAMRKTIHKSGLLDGGMQERIYESMFDQELSRVLSERGALGIAQMLYEEFAPSGPGHLPAGSTDYTDYTDREVGLKDGSTDYADYTDYIDRQVGLKDDILSLFR